MSELRERMIKDMKLRNFSPKTIKSYISSVSQLALYYHKSPDIITQEEIEDYLLYLSEERGLTTSSCNIATYAFNFLYNQTLKGEHITLKIPRRKTEHKLPYAFSQEEVQRIIDNTQTIRDRLMLMTTYSAGLRVSEVVSLRLEDIESDRMLLRVNQGKGKKDRYTLLSKRLLVSLRNYWKLCKPQQWLFPSKRDQNFHISITVAQKAFTQAKKRAGIIRGKGIHTLRHCFAIHLLEAGVDPRRIQLLMGHKSIQTTLRYLNVTRKSMMKIISPLDLMDSDDDNQD